MTSWQDYGQERDFALFCHVHWQKEFRAET
jgi:hypothetical protein